jgi:hypothetical protein
MLDNAVSSDHLDLSWMDEYNRMLDDQSIPIPEVQTTICAISMFISADTNAIVHVQKEDIRLELLDNGRGSRLSEPQVLQFIQSKRDQSFSCGKTFDNTRAGEDGGAPNTMGSVRYKLENMMVYFVSLDTKQLPHYVHTDIHHDVFFRILSMPGEIIVPPSILFFHSINRIYFVFREMDRIRPPVLSILKCKATHDKMNAASASKKHTKRVRISPDLHEYSQDGYRKTAKLRLSA